MRTHELRRRRREAFTLIELLMVIAIIAILISLTAAALMRVLGKRPEVTTRTEMSQMDGSIQQFQQAYDVKYVPSQLHVCSKLSSYPTPYSQLDHDSIDFITKTIGKNSPSFTTKWNSGIQWVTGMSGTAGEVLEGEQVLVFLLGGIQSVSNGQYTCRGFNPDVSNPDFTNTANTVVPGTTVGPFFTFNSSRLSVPTGKTYFAAYQDPYGPRPVDGKPRFYAFFSSYKTPNGYNKYTSTGALASSASTAASDCASLTSPANGLWPYASAAAPSGTSLPTYVNSTTWQIICCGADGSYGPGSNFTTTGTYYWNASTYGAIPTAGQDDQANFSSGKLQYGN